MPVAAIIWNIVFFLAVWETVEKAKKIGFGNIRFLTDSTKIAYLLILLGTTIGVGMIVVFFQAIFVGEVYEVCRRCFKANFSYTSSPFSYLITVATLFELSLVGFFVALLARNSLMAIRGNT